VVLYRKYRSGIIRAMSLRDEIKQQPAVVRKLLDEGWPEVRALGRALARVEHVTLVARGSSDNAATYGKYLLESIAGIVTALAAPSLVTRYDAPPSYVRGAVIGISQSGASPDVAAVVAEGRRAGAVTIAITNRPESVLGRSAEHVFALRAGVEREVAATKTFTATCVALALLASTTAEARGRSALSLAGLAESVAEAAETDAPVERVAKGIGRAPTVIVLGRGYLYPAALEAALKIKELARIWAEPYSSADFAHGPRTLLRRGTPVLLLTSRGATERESRSLASSLSRRGARVYAITNDGRVAERAREAVVLAAPLSETLVPISLVVVAQLLAVALARRHGRDPERPAGLAKVTRTC
jgi:glucosamine--fructose-6-phosphate aminotransferase (isomerizing)